MMHFEKSVIDYVSECQMSYAANTSHTAPTAHDNLGLMLLKLIVGDIACDFK